MYSHLFWYFEGGYETMSQLSSPEDENIKLKTPIKIRAI
jgi:hypothetical protein